MLDLGVVARFAPLPEPWRNWLVEHFNEVWDTSFFRTVRYPDLATLRERNAVFETFHKAAIATPRIAARARMRSGQGGAAPSSCRLPANRPATDQGPDGGHPIHPLRRRRGPVGPQDPGSLDEATHQYITAAISVRAKQLRLVTRHGEIIHSSHIDIDRVLR